MLAVALLVDVDVFTEEGRKVQKEALLYLSRTATTTSTSDNSRLMNPIGNQPQLE